MRFQRQLFDSRVARRIFGFFVLASFVPLLALAVVLLERVGNALESEALEQLDTTARGYGQFTLDRLVTVAEWLERPALLEAAAAEEGTSFGLEAAVSLTNDTTRPLFGSWSSPFEPANLPAELPTIAVIPATQGPEVVVGARHANGFAFGRLHKAYLAGTDGLLGQAMEVCVYGPPTATLPIHCSAPLPDEAIRALEAARRDRSSGRLTWSSDGEEWLTTYWQLFLPSRFAAESWTVVVSQPRSAALASLAIFNRVVPLAAIFALALIVILAMTQIRRTLNPINALLAGTKRIAAQDFSTPVRIEHRDEFGTLGTALNGMADQLQHQFGALRALADIDQSILQTTAIEPVLETLFRRLEALVPGGRYGVLIIDADNRNHGRFYRHGSFQNTGGERIKLAPELHRWLAAASPDTLTDSATLASLGVVFDRRHGDGTLHVMTMLTGDALAGALVTVSATGTALAARELGSVRDLAARVAVAISAGKREAELFRRAHFDALTSLPNRELLDDRLQQAVAQAQREDRSLAVLFIDLDGFKEINDTLGHRSGDELLKETALRLSAAVRDADTVARLGGDEYAIVLPRVDGPLEAETVAVKAIQALRRPFLVEGREVHVSASIGLAIFPEDGTNAGELLRKADMAMYNAKEAGKSCFRFFAAEMDRRLQERHSLHHDLHNALGAGEFSLAYQPQIDLRTGQLAAVEALLRWRHPIRGSVSPALFVPILEETGLIHEVGAWVLRRALADYVLWRGAGIAVARVAVNVAARQLLDPAFIGMISAALADTGLDGHRLEVELTEASLVQDFNAANEALMQLRGRGVRIALDDFGTGYSSLAYLNELVFDTLKIDRAFVVNLPADKSVAIVKAIIAVAASLNKEVVAEGIESLLQLGQLSHLGCQYGQGYLLGKPLSSAEFVTWAKTRVIQPPGAIPEPRRTASSGA